MNKLLIIVVLLLSGCTTIHFDNGEQKPTSQKSELWHHNVALGLFEVSQPIDLAQQCYQTEWVSIKTERTVVNALASGVVNYALPIWYPKTATITCASQ